ncbi:MAG: hypothetical protein ACRDX8_09940 [Acidimicrobiales bacterium]
MHATTVRGTSSPRQTRHPIPDQLVEQLDWIESTGAYHRAALVRLASASTEVERQDAAREETLAREVHRIAVSRLPPP